MHEKKMAKSVMTRTLDLGGGITGGDDDDDDEDKCDANDCVFVI